MNEPDFKLWIIPLLPLAGAAINGLFGRRFKNGMSADRRFLNPFEMSSVCS